MLAWLHDFPAAQPTYFAVLFTILPIWIGVALAAWSVRLMYRREQVISVLHRRWSAEVVGQGVVIHGYVFYHRPFVKESVSVSCRIGHDEIAATPIYGSPSPNAGNLELHRAYNSTEEFLNYSALVPRSDEELRSIRITLDIRLSEGSHVHERFNVAVTRPAVDVKARIEALRG